MMKEVDDGKAWMPFTLYTKLCTSPGSSNTELERISMSTSAALLSVTLDFLLCIHGEPVDTIWGPTGSAPPTSSALKLLQKCTIYIT